MAKKEQTDESLTFTGEDEPLTFTGEQVLYTDEQKAERVAKLNDMLSGCGEGGSISISEDLASFLGNGRLPPKEMRTSTGGYTLPVSELRKAVESL